MERVLIAVAVGVAVVALAWALQRRRSEPPTQARWAVPAQLDRRDFDGPETSWLVAVFTSSTCESCAEAVAKAAPLAGPDVVVQEVEVEVARDLHRRYGIEAVPTVVIADAEGVVRSSFVGPPVATQLWAAMAEAREEG